MELSINTPQLYLNSERDMCKKCKCTQIHEQNELWTFDKNVKKDTKGGSVNYVLKKAWGERGSPKCHKHLSTMVEGGDKNPVNEVYE